METPAGFTVRRSAPRRLLRGAGLVLLWTVGILLGAFGIVFAFANYPAIGIAFVVLFLVLVGDSERRRRARRAAAESARRRERARRADL